MSINLLAAALVSRIVLARKTSGVRRELERGATFHVSQSSDVDEESRAVSDCCYFYLVRPGEMEDYYRGFASIGILSFAILAASAAWMCVFD